jgi:outer membrane protein, heavy metal efflux system
VTPVAPPGSDLSAMAAATPLGGQSLSLQAAMYGALTSNPDLVTLRQGNPLAASAEAVEVARHFPTTLNPTLWIDYRPITLIPPTQAIPSTGLTKGSGHGGYYHFGQELIYISLRQPIELGHQTTHRYHIAQAAYNQQQWTVLQAELTALVQTYRFFQTAAYRRERFRLAQQLADFNDRLLATLRRQLEASQPGVTVADVALARIESQGTRQQVKAARQDYLTALGDLRNQVGISEEAGTVEPFGEFSLPQYIPPVDEKSMVETALANRPDIHALKAQIDGTQAAVRLAQGDRIPTPVVGPIYEMDEAGVQYVGLALISQLPIWNNGKPLVHQRQAEYQRAIVAVRQAEQRATAQVKAAVARWNAATDLVNDSADLSVELTKEVGDLERLFELRQADLTRLMQARQRLIQLENSRLDAVWAATQAQSDLLLALGAPSLIQAMLTKAQRDAGTEGGGQGATPAQPTGPSSATTPPTPTPGDPRTAATAATRAPAVSAPNAAGRR